MMMMPKILALVFKKSARQIQYTGRARLFWPAACPPPLLLKNSKQLAKKLNRAASNSSAPSLLWLGTHLAPLWRCGLGRNFAVFSSVFRAFCLWLGVLLGARCASSKAAHTRPKYGDTHAATVEPRSKSSSEAKTRAPAIIHMTSHGDMERGGGKKER